MPGVKWQTWKPYFVPESEGLIESWVAKVQDYLNGLDESVDKVSSRSIKNALKAGKVAPMTWTKVIRLVAENKNTQALKNSMGEGVFLHWKKEGSSLVRVTAEQYGFTEEVA